MALDVLDVEQQRAVLADVRSLIDHATKTITVERIGILSKIEAVLAHLIPVSKIPLEEICNILGLTPEIQRTRNGVILKLKNALRNKVETDCLRLGSEETSVHIIDEVFIPTNPTGSINNGEGDFVIPDIFPRGKLIVETLESLGVDINSCKILCGTNTPEMFRTLSYQLIIIPSLEKMILFCDEGNNRTFVVHGLKDPRSMYRKNKDQLKEHPDVEHFIWSQDQTSWCELLTTILQRATYEKSAPSTAAKPSEKNTHAVVMDGYKIIEVDGQPAMSVKAFAQIYTGEGICTERSLSVMLRYYDIQPIATLARNARVFPIETLKNMIPQLQNNGEILLFGETYTTHTIYERTANKLSKKYIKRHMEKAGLLPHPMLKRAAGRYYLKSEIEAALPPIMSDDGYATVRGRIAVGLERVAGSTKYPFNPKVLRQRLRDAGVAPIPYVEVRNHGAGVPPKEIFWEDDLASVMPLFLSHDGTIEVDGNVYVSLLRYLTARKQYSSHRRYSQLSPAHLDKDVYSGTTLVQVYLKSEVDAITS